MESADLFWMVHSRRCNNFYFLIDDSVWLEWEAHTGWIVYFDYIKIVTAIQPYGKILADHVVCVFCIK